MTERQQELRKQGLRRLAWASGGYMIGLALLLVAAVFGMADYQRVAIFATYVLSGMALFFALLWQRRMIFADAMLVYAQVLFAIGATALAYSLFSVARSAVLQWLCLVIVFDMQRLKARQTFVAAVLAASVPAIWLAVERTVLPRPDTRLIDEIVFAGLAAIIVPALLLGAAESRNVSAQSRAQKERMAEALEQLRLLSTQDGLTGLFNRGHMQQLMHAEFVRQKRSGRSFCVALLDLDHFKLINDRFGHSMGDLVLRQFARLASECISGGADAVARWGGEEFLVLMPETSVNEAGALISLLQEKVRSVDWRAHAQDLKVSFSAGLCEHAFGSPLEETLRRADEALYRAKAEGRNRIVTDEGGAVYQAAPQPAVQHAVSASSTAPPTGKPLARLPVVECQQARIAASDSTCKPTDERNPLPAWARWLLGEDTAMRARLRYYLVPTAVYSAWIFVSFQYTNRPDLIPREVIPPLQIGMLAAVVIPGVLIRSGLTAKWKDPALFLPQMLWAVALDVVAYASSPYLRPLVMQALCHVVVFGFIGLRPKGVKVFGTVVVLALFGMLAFMTIRADPAFSLPYEALQVAMSSIVLSLIGIQSYRLSKRRERVEQERTDLAIATGQVQRVLAHDALTGLPNRTRMQSLLEEERLRCQRSGHSFCVALIDLDHFKNINDRFGHQAGDEVLIKFSNAVIALLRDVDRIGRWGGEEFLIVLTEADAAIQGLEAIERLRVHITQLALCADQPDLQVTFSAGLARWQPDEMPAQLLERADKALYSAKSQGRNQCVLAP